MSEQATNLDGLSGIGKKALLEIVCRAVSGKSFKDFKRANPQWKLVLQGVTENLFRRSFTRAWVSSQARQMRAEGWDLETPRVKSLVEDGVDEGLGEMFVLSRDFLFRFYRRLGVPGVLRDGARDATDNEVFAAALLALQEKPEEPVTLERICSATLAAAKSLVLKVLFADE